MATILSSKSFIVDKAVKFSLELVEEWFKDNLLAVHSIKSDLRFTVTLETYGDTKKKKNTATAELESMAVDAALEDKDVWSNGEYKFCFASKKYLWKKQEIYLTANEQLFLFRRLVLKDELHKRQTFYLRNMRRRLGKEFLSDIAEEK